MSSIRAINEKLFWDFRYLGVRCREYTAFADTPANRSKMEKVLKMIDSDIASGNFDYRRYFPSSKQAAKFDAPAVPGVPENPISVAVAKALPTQNQKASPLFSAFAESWYVEFEVGWRRSYRRTVREIIDIYLLSRFGAQEVGGIRRADILLFRSELARVPGRRKGSSLSPARVNTIMLILSQILNEAADRFEFATPCQRIKPLRVPKSDVLPFTLDEVRMVLEKVRPDYRDYYIVRFFTGMRTGEIDGLKWKYVDFEHRLILVRETIVAGEEDYTKTDSSQRDIQMSTMVYEAMKRQRNATGSLSKFVFCTKEGQPLDHNNVTKRVWYPLLRHLGLKQRRPYQTRHTAATLWVASGENPEWIARQLGHSSTEMLFTVYSRFIPNLTRRDGSAFERLIAGNFGPAAAVAADNQAGGESHADV